MSRFASVALAGLLIASSAFAADADQAASLTPGKPAGVQQATLAGGGLLIFFGLAVVAGGIALVSSQGGGGNVAVSTTTTAP